MNVLLFDIPLLFTGLILLAWAKKFRSEQYFQMLCQFLSTFAAQYSFGVSWSLARLVPIVSAAGILKARPLGLNVYLPFVVYVVISSILLGQFWEIPSTVQYWYGEGRVYLQVFNFCMLAASSVALASAISEKGGVPMMLLSLDLAAIVHGFASLYQLVAIGVGLPLIGISRAHGLTIDDGIGDVAAFLTDRGVEILRPGGLMGEPKSAAVLFGIVLIHRIFRKEHKEFRTIENLIQTTSVILSAIGFIAAFATSAFVGFAGAVLVCMMYISGPEDRIQLIIRIAFIGAIAFIGWYLYYGNSDEGLLSVMFQRTAGRFDGGEMDPPVEASINEIINNPMTALFGVGQGGSSFVAMKFIGEAFDYALAPNITFVLLLVEAGMVGTMLFLGVFGMQVVRVGTSVIVKDDSEIRTLFVIGLSAMLLNLAGSGIPLGIPLAVACMAVAAHKVRLAARTNIPEGSMNVWFHQ